MAYMNQEKKAKIAAALKVATAGTGLKYSLSVRNHMSIDLTIKSGPIDFIGDYNETTRNMSGYRQITDPEMSINQYWYQEHFSPKVKSIVEKIVNAMKAADYFDDSDAQTDYFNTAYFMNINVGRWNKPYVLIK